MPKASNCFQPFMINKLTFAHLYSILVNKATYNLSKMEFTNVHLITISIPNGTPKNL